MRVAERHGVSMMGPDYTHWHGTYEVAKRFYVDMVPELEELADGGEKSGDPAKVAAARKLRAKLAEVLNSDNHRWYLDKLSPEEKEIRRQRQAEFQKRYGK